MVGKKILVPGELDPVESDLCRDLGEIGFGLGDLGLVDGWINLGENLSLPDMRVEVDVDLHDDAADLGPDMNGVQGLEASRGRYRFFENAADDRSCDKGGRLVGMAVSKEEEAGHCKEAQENPDNRFFQNGHQRLSPDL